MEKTMSVRLELALAPERLDEGLPEERACFGLFTIRCGEIDLTGGFDYYISNYRPGPLVSGYHAAEWFAWNWWRLRCEPRSAAPEWWQAHKMTAIGEGYVWPNLTIYSDGVWTTLVAERSRRPDAKPFRYFGAPPCILPSETFEAAVDAFVRRMLARLRDQQVPKSNLDCIWSDILAERCDPDLSKRRRLEALLGRDPDEVDDDAVDRLLADTGSLGEQAIQELAAAGAGGATPPSADTLERIADVSGFSASPRDSARFSADTRLPSARELTPWRLGAEAARVLRRQEDLGSQALGDETLASLAGVPAAALDQSRIPQPSEHGLSFSLDDTRLRRRVSKSRVTKTGSKVVLRSRRHTGRRFELARLLADRLVAPPQGRLHAATGAYTYRQKMQRSFAAELLSPFEAVDDMLAGDYSPEALQDAAEHFQVSERTILTLLVNHRRLELDELQAELEPVA
jgi:hypothetical protein